VRDDDPAAQAAAKVVDPADAVRVALIVTDGKRRETEGRSTSQICGRSLIASDNLTDRDPETRTVEHVCAYLRPTPLQRAALSQHLGPLPAGTSWESVHV